MAAGAAAARAVAQARASKAPGSEPDLGRVRSSTSAQSEQIVVIGTQASRSLPRQRQASEIYQHTYLQVSVAVLIFANFICSAIQTEMLPEEGSSADTVFFCFEVFFNVCFTLELILNFYGSFFTR